MALGSLRPSPLVEQAAERLREQITGGQWPVGTKLPGETTLATLLGVGRSTVREALRALFDHYLEHPEELPEARPGVEPVQRVVDYLAGMTDRFCLTSYERLRAETADR